MSGYESEDFGYWMYGVNDAMANVGAGSQEMVDGDVIYFQYMIDWENASYVTSSGLVINFIENFNTPIVTDITASVCSGDVYAENGFNIITTDLAPGVQSFTRRSEHVECQPDEVYNLELTINPTYEENQSLEIAQSDLPYTYGDTLFAVGTVSGEYRVYDVTEAGCDSVIVLSLTVGDGTITSTEAQNVANLVVYQSSDAAQLFINAENDLAQISILSISGQTVLSVDAHNNQAVVDIANLQKGVYFVRVLMADGTKQVAKFIKQ